MTDSPKTWFRLRRKAALAEYREALKEFRRFHGGDGTAGYREAAERLEKAEQRLMRLRAF